MIGKLINNLLTVDFDIWNKQEVLNSLKNMDLQKFKEEFFSTPEKIKKFYLLLKETSNLNVDRNVLMDNIDQEIVNIIKSNFLSKEEKDLLDKVDLQKPDPQEPKDYVSHIRILKNDWLGNGEGYAFDKNGLDWFNELLNTKLKPINAQYVYPTPQLNVISVEFDFSNDDFITLEINTQTKNIWYCDRDKDLNLNAEKDEDIELLLKEFNKKQ